jgi:hypothetical protein
VLSNVHDDPQLRRVDPASLLQARLTELFRDSVIGRVLEYLAEHYPDVIEAVADVGRLALPLLIAALDERQRSTT